MVKLDVLSATMLSALVVFTSVSCNPGPPPDDTACASDGDCVDGRRCVSSVCRYAVPLGSACVDHVECGSSFCHGPEGSRVCEEPGSRRVGVSCHLEEACETGVCDSPVTSAKIAGHCVFENGAEEECAADEICRSRSVCRRASADRPRQCNDVWATTGEYCERTTECSAEGRLICVERACRRPVFSVCSGSDETSGCEPNTHCICGVCLPPNTVAGACCGAREHCAGSMTCTGGVCALPPGTAGDPCSLSATGASTCAEGLLCANGRCVPA